MESVRNSATYISCIDMTADENFVASFDSPSYKSFTLSYPSPLASPETYTPLLLTVVGEFSSVSLTDD